MYLTTHKKETRQIGGEFSLDVSLTSQNKDWKENAFNSGLQGPNFIISHVSLKPAGKQKQLLLTLIITSNSNVFCDIKFLIRIRFKSYCRRKCSGRFD